MSDKDVLSVLKMDKLVFDKIHFDRIGFKNKSSELKLSIEIKIGEMKEQNTSVVSVTMNGDKKEEYSFSVTVSGYFSIERTQLDRDKLLRQNAVAILMPYIRSEISLLTAQPETECVVLPPFNVSKMMEDQHNI